MQIGYSKPLYVLAFDHRASFVEGVLNEHGAVTAEEQELIKKYKDTIFAGFLKGMKGHVPRGEAAVLVDEQFGEHVLARAAEEKVVRILTVEKSGQAEFDFEYGPDYKAHLERFRPDFAKVLLRYNAEGDQELNRRQRQKLKELSDYAHAAGIRLLVEPIVAPTPEQLLKVGGDKARFDEEVRPILTVRLIADVQQDGIEVDVWKIEGFVNRINYELVALQAHVGLRHDVGVVILGRAEKREKVAEWLRAGSGVPGVIGFAVGRTIFWDPLKKLHAGTAKPEEAEAEIAAGYRFCYDVFKGKG